MIRVKTIQSRESGCRLPRLGLGLGVAWSESISSALVLFPRPEACCSHPDSSFSLPLALVSACPKGHVQRRPRLIFQNISNLGSGRGWGQGTTFFFFFFFFAVFALFTL